MDINAEKLPAALLLYQWVGQKRLQGRIERAIGFVGAGIEGNTVRIWRGMFNGVNGQLTRLLDRAIDAASNTGQERGPEGWTFLRAGCDQFHAQNISDNLSPDWTF